MATDPADLPRSVFEAFQARERDYVDACGEFERRVRVALVAAGLKPSMVTSRPKEAIDLYKKQRRKRYVSFWETCPDVLGARIVVSVADEKLLAFKALEVSGDLAVFDHEDQSEDADPDLLAYKGLHVHVRAADLIGIDGKPMRCEVQIRTLAEHAWAETEHRYLYKKDAGIPKVVRRIFRRLLVLVELFDEELQKGVDLVKKNPVFAQHNLVRSLEQRFARIASVAGDEELTREVLDTLARHGYSDPNELTSVLDGYLERHEQKVLDILERHGVSSDGFDPDDGWIMTQPESLLLLALLDQDEYRLATALEGEDLAAYVEPLARWADHPGFIRA